MTPLREFRADAPAPDRGRLAPGRRRLLDEAVRGGRVRDRWAGWWPAVAAGAAVVATAVVSVGILPVGGGSGGGGGAEAPPAASLRPHPDLRDAAAVLERAAAAVERLPDPVPLDDHWVYVKSLHEDRGEGTDPSHEERWVRYAGTGTGPGDPGKGKEAYPRPRERFDFLASLPDDPRKVLERARGFHASTGDEAEYPWYEPARPGSAYDYQALAALVRTYPAAHGGLAAVYRTLASVEGVKVVDHLVEDAAGRDVVAVYFDGAGKRPEGFPRTRDELLIDPETYTYAGSRSVVLADYSGELPDGTVHELRKGEFFRSVAVVRTALVGARDERP
ncbi:hypothetical protein CUT44_06810 [Streptomyces carminius]|uniref:CU044_5270 family protein n=2 Tax=Streptomyces carminius TaxID=2665496 RepID=A0A2M8M2I5_9ACTN|nr:hypothetical protein CUT44_06810 [Streptomyces carminius]